MEEIHQANGEVIGISVDSPFTQAKWAELEKFPNVLLLSDIGKETAQAYDVFYPDLIGLKGIAKRAAFVIDKEGKVVHQEIMENAREIPDLDVAIAKMKASG